MATACRFLFAYGTLLSGDSGATGRAQRARLAREGRVLGEGCLPGLLYDLGRYPALVVGGGDGAVVQGEVVELSDPDRSLAWLDAYEGIMPGDHPHNDYERVQRPVTLSKGGTVEAWVYVWRAGLERAVLIPGGRWLAR
jgi:gamma-glutamylcyclotransferase (GGCT)/AIG2-like uncharacterized protein YtfP